MEYNNVQILNDGDSNIIEIAENVPFTTSRIHIKGNRNRILIGKANSITNLFLNIKGDSKTIIIGNSTKNINNLKYTSIRGNHQSLTIGENFSCGGIEIQMNDGHENCTIGNDCLFSWGIKMRTSDGHSIIDLNTSKPINYPKDITIGNHVWIGEDAKFLKGSSIPSNCVVGAYSVVTKKFEEEYCVIAGFPAKILKTNTNWDRRRPFEIEDLFSK